MMQANKHNLIFLKYTVFVSKLKHYKVVFIINKNTTLVVDKYYQS